VVESDKKKSPEKYYSLLELTSSIQTVIKKTYTSSYWVKAEIAKLNYYPKSGHCYPDLVEKEKGVVLAQIRATIWAGQFNDLAKKFLLVTNEPLSDGMTVLVRTSVNYHPVYGLGLQITDIQPSFTLGEMARERLHTIEQLKAQNIFERNKQLVPALLIQRIAVISVETSKGYHDFTKIISENEWGYKFFLMLFPAILQGEAAINSITEQLNRIKKAQKHFDAVVIIRGGGGDIGLSSYDNFKLAKSCCTLSSANNYRNWAYNKRNCR
jgi:Exonuclease VII, large subunit